MNAKNHNLYVRVYPEHSNFTEVPGSGNAVYMFPIIPTVHYYIAFDVKTKYKCASFFLKGINIFISHESLTEIPS